MIVPLAIAAATVLSPIVATTLLSFGLVATASNLTRTRKPVLVTNEKSTIHGLNEMSRLHDKLKLDARQETLWHKAEKGDWDSMGENHQCFRKQYEEALRMINQPGPELLSERSSVGEQSVSNARCDRWMSVYDTLNAGQKETASRFFQTKLERMECFGPCNKGVF